MPPQVLTEQVEVQALKLHKTVLTVQGNASGRGLAQPLRSIAL